jgi:hypothetical protein
MRPEQCREARARLKWSRHALAVAADVPLWFVAAFENEDDIGEFLADYEDAMRKAFEAVGIGFPFEIANGRMRPAGITYSPRDKGETH